VPDSVPAPLLQRRPDLQVAERAIAASTARVGAAEAARLPAISILGSYGSQASSPDDVFSSNTTVYQLQAGFSVPLFNNGRITSQVSAERARTTEARAIYEQTALNAMREASDALTGIRTTRDEVAANASRVASLRAALNLAQLRYNSGLAPYLDLLDAQRSLFAAELSLSQAELRQLTAVVVLYKAIGGSWATS
jgi:outer membrane protein, multidrug efflux system